MCGIRFPNLICTRPMKLILCTIFVIIFLNPLSARIFTDFGYIERQSVTQGRMGRDPPRYPPRDPGL